MSNKYLSGRYQGREGCPSIVQMAQNVAVLSLTTFCILKLKIQVFTVVKIFYGTLIKNGCSRWKQRLPKRQPEALLAKTMWCGIQRKKTRGFAPECFGYGEVADRKRWRHRQNVASAKQTCVVLYAQVLWEKNSSPISLFQILSTIRGPCHMRQFTSSLRATKYTRPQPRQEAHCREVLYVPHNVLFRYNIYRTTDMLSPQVDLVGGQS